MAEQHTVAFLDAVTEKLQIKRVNETGADLPLKGSITLELPATLGSDGNYHEIKLREVIVCVNGGNSKIILPCSEFF